MSISFLEGVDFSCGLVLAEDDGLWQGGCQLDGRARPHPRVLSSVNVLLTLVSKRKSLKLAQESSAEAGVPGGET